MENNQAIVEISQHIDELLDRLIAQLEYCSEVSEMIPIVDLMVFKFRSPKILAAIVEAINKFSPDATPDKLVFYASECPVEETVEYFLLWIDLVCLGTYSVAFNAYYILADMDDPDKLKGKLSEEAEYKLKAAYKSDDEKAVIISDLLGMFI